MRKILFGCFLFVFLRQVEGLGLSIWTKRKFHNIVHVKPFWKNTGLSPASDQNHRTEFLLSDDEKLNFDFIGALPNKAITLVRIHWLLDLVTVSDRESENPKFHLENLDRLIYRLYRNDLYPSFELMGNPSNFFKDFKGQSKHWISLIQKILTHYSNLYGADYVAQWRFELMNEPDLKQYNSYNFTLEDYINYFKASEEAVANLAGPAGLFRENKKAHPICWGFLDYCNSNPCNLNMITFHRKGDGVGSNVVEEGLQLINSLISEYPNLKGIPFGNDEADILTGWYKPAEWRADVRYAALVLQVIIGHIEEMFIRRNIEFEMLSNDNAFLSFSPNYFTQRTLLARFQMNDTHPSHVQFFKKPVYSVMGLLSLLGPYLNDVRYHPGENGFSYLVTTYKYEDTFLGVITDDRAANETYDGKNATHMDVNFKMVLGNLTLSGMCVGYVMDNDNSNPHGVWRDGGSPHFPDEALRRRMREAETFQSFITIKSLLTKFEYFPEQMTFHGDFSPQINQHPAVFVQPGSVDQLTPKIKPQFRPFICRNLFDAFAALIEGFKRIFVRKVKPHQSQVKFVLRDVLVPSVIAIQVCFEGTEEPGQVTDLHYASVTKNEIILFWKDTLVDSRCILTYVVEFKKKGDTEFRRINKMDSIFLSYHHDGLDQNGTFVGIEGEYRVAAVDYWNRSGPYSDPLIL